MTYKYILCIALLHNIIHSDVDIEPIFLANSPSDYLLDVVKALTSHTATRSIGNELNARNYQYQLDPYYDTEIGRFDEMPPLPNTGTFIDNGFWLWIPDIDESEIGTWYWLLNELPYYIQVLSGQIPFPPSN